MRKILGCLVGVVLLSIAPLSNLALAQAGPLESRITRGVGLPQTAWIKAEILGDTAVEQRARDKVNDLLRQRGYVPEKFSPYAVRIEIRGAGVQPTQVAIPQYNNTLERLSLWNASSAAENVTVSLTLYHQSSGRVLWQAEAACRNMDGASIPGSMIVPMMDQFGRSMTGNLSCTRG